VGTASVLRSEFGVTQWRCEGEAAFGTRAEQLLTVPGAAHCVSSVRLHIFDRFTTSVYRIQIRVTPVSCLFPLTPFASYAKSFNVHSFSL
jgi:hypothetical protein